MKPLLIAFTLMLGAATFSHAATEEQFRGCLMQGEIFQMAARSRDQGIPPETTYGIASGYLKAGIPQINKQFLKNVINAVYFDSEFANAGGPRLADQVRQYCLTGGKPQFQPLK